MQTYIKTTDFARAKLKPGPGQIMPGNFKTGPSSLSEQAGKDDKIKNNNSMTDV